MSTEGSSTVDLFLKLDGISGESKDAIHAGEIDIFSWSFGTAKHFDYGEVAGKASFKNITVTKTVDKASTQLVAACVENRLIKTLVITCRKAGKDQQEYLVITGSNVLVISWNAGGSDRDGQPAESVEFSFRKIDMNYREQLDNGTLGGVMSVSCDLK